MVYTIEFDSNGVPFCFSQYDDEPAELLANEHICSQEQAKTWQRCVLQNGVVVLVKASDEELLEQAKASQCAMIDAAYREAIVDPVSFTTSAGVTKKFDADANSQLVLAQATQGYAISGTVPVDFYWVAADNTKVPFVLGDLRGLYEVMLAQGWSAFQKRQSLKSSINASTNIADALAISW